MNEWGRSENERTATIQAELPRFFNHGSSRDQIYFISAAQPDLIETVIFALRGQVYIGATVASSAQMWPWPGDQSSTLYTSLSAMLTSGVYLPNWGVIQEVTLRVPRLEATLSSVNSLNKQPTKEITVGYKSQTIGQSPCGGSPPYPRDPHHPLLLQHLIQYLIHHLIHQVHRHMASLGETSYLHE